MRFTFPGRAHMVSAFLVNLTGRTFVINFRSNLVFESQSCGITVRIFRHAGSAVTYFMSHKVELRIRFRESSASCESHANKNVGKRAQTKSAASACQ